jgi:hypothetical protein
MTKISFRAAHEQADPRALLDDAIYMDRKGIQKRRVSDQQGSDGWLATRLD